MGAGDSDLAWNALGGVDIWLGERTSLMIGYRIVDFDYSGSSFSFDERIHGPCIGVPIRF